VPAQPLLAATPLRDQVVTMVNQQLQLAQHRFAWAWPLELGFLQCRSGDRERVDPVRLAAHPAAAALRRRQPWRHPHQPFTRIEQLLLESARDVPAILERPQPPLAERPRPGHHSALDRPAPLSKRAAEPVDRSRRQRLLVYVHSDHDHSTRLHRQEGATGERTDLNRGESHAPIRSHSTVSGRRRRHNTGKPAESRHSGIESAAANPNSQTRTRRHTPTVTLSCGMSPGGEFGLWRWLLEPLCRGERGLPHRVAARVAGVTHNDKLCIRPRVR
jgi:hypothetical protein